MAILFISMGCVALGLLAYAVRAQRIQRRARLRASVETLATERFQELARRYDEASRLAMGVALEVRHRTDEEFKLVIASAECVLWHAEVEDAGTELKWDLRVFVEERGDFVSMQDVPPDYRVGAWYHGRKEADMYRLAENATAAIRSGLPGYRQEFECRAKDGSLVWFQEDTRIEKVAPNRYHLFGVSMDITDRKRAEEQREQLVRELTEALAQVKQLRGMLPICASCKKIRDDAGYWSQIETYIRKHAGVEFSHGICPECAQRLYPELMSGPTVAP
jgi:PAS domain-containing protein